MFCNWTLDRSFLSPSPLHAFNTGTRPHVSLTGFNFCLFIVLNSVCLSLFHSSLEMQMSWNLSPSLVFFLSLHLLNNFLHPTLALFLHPAFPSSHLHLVWRWEKGKIRSRLALWLFWLCTRSLSGSIWPSLHTACTCVCVCVHACHLSSSNRCLP